jgi:hypothetical protein
MKLYVEVPYVKLRALIGDDISKYVRSYDYIEPFRILTNHIFTASMKLKSVVTPGWFAETALNKSILYQEKGKKSQSLF